MSEVDFWLSVSAVYVATFALGIWHDFRSDAKALREVERPDGPAHVVLSDGQIRANIHHIMRKVREGK